MEVLDLILGKPTLRWVTEQLAKELRKRGDVDLKVDLEAGSIELGDTAGKGSCLYAHNLLHDVRKAPRSMRAAMIKRFLGGATEFDQDLIDSYAAAAPQLLPVVRADDEASLHALMGFLAGDRHATDSKSPTRWRHRHRAGRRQADDADTRF